MHSCMARRSIEITGRDLVELVTSASFQLNLARAARYTARTGHESGFSEYMDVEERATYSTDVIKGAPAHIDIPPYQEWAAAERGKANAKGFDLLKLHFHTYDPRFQPLGLSESDFYALENRPFDGFDVRTIAAIGRVGGQKGELVLLQRTCQDLAFGGSLAEQLEDTAAAESAYGTLDQFVRALEIPGFTQADILRFSLPSCDGSARVENPDVLGRYGHTARFPTDDTSWGHTE